LFPARVASFVDRTCARKFGLFLGQACKKQDLTPTRARVAASVLLLLTATSSLQAQSAASAKWEKDIAAFEVADRTNLPPKNALLFVGSSTIVRWKTLETDFPNQPIVNRGFGGNEIADSTYFADRIIFPYRPKMIFLRAGGNDIHNGKSPEQVFEDFKTFVSTVHAKLPDTEIAFISLSPSIARWAERDANKKLNTLIAEYVKGKPRLKYIDTWSVPLDANGQPRPELFVEDKLHLSPEGYKLLVERVRPFIPR
jgi:lysophospholipase L1-like esterase